MAEAVGPPRKRSRPDWWVYVAFVFLLIEAGLWGIPQLRPGPLGVVCWMFGSDRCLWTGIVVLWGLIALAWSIWRRPMLRRWRFVGLAMLALAAAAPYAFRVYPSSHDDRPSEVEFRVPLDGPIAVAWGGSTPDVNYHVVAPDQRWAYDLFIMNEGKTYENDGDKLEDYYCYGLPVLAPAGGVVRAVYADSRDMPIGMLGGLPAGGNQIVIEVAQRQYLFLCHLKPGSIRVKRGDRVEQGQEVALVGNSGNTSEPHLHVHLQDTPKLHLGEGIPLYFSNYRVGRQVIERGIPTGGFHHGQWAGQIIEHVDAEPQAAEPK